MATVNLEEKRKFRGKFLGKIDINNIDEFVKSHGITDGTFDDLCVGDYFISEITTDRERVVVFRIADFDIYAGTESTAAKSHHVCIVPDTIMLKWAMYECSEDFESNGYGPSDMNQVIMNKINKAMESVFGKYLLRYTELLSSGVYGYNEKFTVKGILMSEMELLGTREYALKENEVFIDKQLALFAEKPEFINPTDIWIWLRDISKYYSSTGFVNCGTNGSTYDSRAATTYGVRPRFLLG